MKTALHLMVLTIGALGCALARPLAAQSLEEDLLRLPASDLAALARQVGDPLRGGIVFFQQHLGCSNCHSVGNGKTSSLGPDLTTLDKQTGDEALVEAVLLPSKVIRKGFESVTVLTTDGIARTGLLVERTDEKVVMREIAAGGQSTAIAAADIEKIKASPLSLMPAGQVNQLASRQQFLDLIRYVMELRDGGAARARELQPPVALVALQIPEYEQHLDHAGLIGRWNAESLERGEAIYRRVCANCHGTVDRPGSLPTSLRFAEGKFKNGSDPLAMYRTLTYGFGFMAAQTWMVPSQKYDVIHYIREAYLRPHNPSQLAVVDAQYLARLPKGDTRGPEASKIEPWSAMDYGPSLTHTYEVPGGAHNFAYKGIAIRLDAGSGGVSRGRQWMAFDTDTLRMAAAWRAAAGESQDENFINWRGIQFNGEHQIHPALVGQVALANSTGPGWADPASGSFQDDRRVVGRDGRRYGPLPREWGKFHGLYHHGQQVVLSYSVGNTEVLESPRLVAEDQSPPTPVYCRTFNIAPRDRDLVLQVAELASADAKVTAVEGTGGAVVNFEAANAERGKTNNEEPSLAFDGNTWLEIANPAGFDLMTQDYSIAARIKTTGGGSIFAIARPGPKWTPDGQTLFIRGGRLCFDIGWVGVVSGKTKVNDGQWHNVAMTWQKSTSRVRLYVDGRLDGEGALSAKKELPGGMVRIGFTAPDFPSPDSHFTGELAEVRFYQRRLADGLNDFAEPIAKESGLVGRWRLDNVAGALVADRAGHDHDGAVHRSTSSASQNETPLLAGFAPSTLR